MISHLRKISFKLYKMIYGHNVYSYSIDQIKPIVDKHLNSNELFLDGACGYRNPWIADIKLKNSIGLDIDKDAIKHNKSHKSFIIQDLHDEINLKNVKTVLSVYTLEHLKNPKKVLLNFKNILHDDGKIIIIAPLKYHYVSILERILPNFLKNFGWRLAKGKSHMPYPCYFELCTRKEIEDYAKEINLTVVEYKTIAAPPTWFGFMPPIFFLLCIFNDFINRFTFFENIRSTFIIVLRK